MDPDRGGAIFAALANMGLAIEPELRRPQHGPDEPPERCRASFQPVDFQFDGRRQRRARRVLAKSPELVFQMLLGFR